MDLKPASPEVIARILGECTVIPGGYKCKCPAHEDKQASLQINIVGSRDGKTTVHCYAGCRPGDVFKAIEEKTGMYFESRVKAARKEGDTDLVYPAPIDWPPLLAYNNIPHSVAYEYRNADGHLVFVVARWNLPGGSKRILPYSVTNAGGQHKWIAKLQLKPRPLYNLGEVLERPEATVLIVEGEKAVEAGKLDQQFDDYVIVTYQGGAGNWKHSDWGPLRGRKVILLPDNDDAGRESFVELAQHLGLNEFCPTPMIAYHAADFPPKWDIADQWPEGADFSVFKFYKAPETSIDFVKNNITPVNYMESFSSMFWLYYDGTYQWTVSKQRWINIQGSPFSSYGMQRINSIHPYVRACYIGREPAINVWANQMASEDNFVSGFRFRPETEEPIVVEDGMKYINTYRGLPYKQVDIGKCDLILSFIRDIICDGDEEANVYVLNYLSHMLQFPSHRPTVAIVLRGEQGAGKSTFGQIVGRLLGTSKETAGYFASFGTLDKVLGKFNVMLTSKLAIFIEELEITKSRTMENALKNLITEPTLMIEPKGKEQYVENNYARILGGTNHNHIWNVSKDERRLTLLNISNAHANDGMYFGPLYAEIKNIDSFRAFFSFLMQWNVDHDLVRKPLRNQARAEQAIATKTPNKELALRMLRVGEIDLRILDERREVIASYYQSRKDWDNGVAKLPSNLAKRVLQAEIESGKYGETSFSAKDGRVSIKELVKQLGWTEPENNRGYTTVTTINRGEKDKDAGYYLPNLQQARVAFCNYHNISYESVFGEEDEKIVPLAQLDAAASEPLF
jgi:hypothetical protein